MAARERRGAQRVPLELQGYAIINGSVVGLRTRDISQSGGLLRLATDTPLHSGTRLLVRLDMRLRGMAAICRVSGQGRCALYGVRFDRFDAHSDLILLAYLVRYEQNLLPETSS